MVQFAIATAASIALNLAINALTQEETTQDETKAVLKSSYGFPLEKPFGKKWRLRNRNVIWGLPIKDEEEDAGGKGGGGAKEVTSYATFAVMGGWGKIKNVTKIWVGNEIWWDWDGDFESSFRKAKKRKYIKNLGIYYGSDDQTSSSLIEKHEGIGNVNSLKKRFYVVFDRLEVDPGSGYPAIDIEVESEEQTLPEVVKWSCEAKGLTNEQIEIDSALEAYTEVNIDIPQDGGTVSDFIKELQKSYFFFTIDTGDKIIFRDFYTPESLGIVNLKTENLAATPENESAIARYLAQIPDVLDLPSELQFEYISSDRNYDRGFQPAYRHGANHFNDTVIKTRQNLNDQQGRDIAWKTMGIYWSQSRKLQNISLLPAAGKELEMGNLFTVPIDGVDRFFQLEKKEVGDNDLVEISAVSYDKVNPNFQFSTPIYVNQPLPEIATGTVIPLDIPLIKDIDSSLDSGIYLGVTSSGEWSNGAIFASADGGNSFAKLINFTGQSTVGTVSQVPNITDTSVIDYGSELIVVLDNDYNTLESIPEEDFLELKQMGLISNEQGSEIFAWQNAELIAPRTYKLTKLLRGLRGTERHIHLHAVGNRFVLLKGTGARLVRVPGAVTDFGKTFTFKAVHSGQTLDEITDEVSLTINGEGIKPYSPCNVRLTKDTASNDLILEWSLRTRTNGQWRDRVDIVHSDSDRTLLQILSGTDTVHQIEVLGYQPSYRITAAEQISYFGSLQSQLDINLFQISNLIGYGNPLAVRGLEPNRFV